MKQTILFCDFDGTITENDNIIAIMKQFDPPGWQPIVEQILGRTMSIREGVGALFALLPASQQNEVTRYVLDAARIRSGFPQLLDYCKTNEIAFLVTSGGIDFFVHPLLSPYPIPPDHIYCNGSDFSGDRIRITWPHPCDAHCSNDCGMCKTTIMRNYPPEQYHRILIGDSVTDYEGAKLADLVFARSHLLDMCQQHNLPYIPYDTFHDVIDHLNAARAKEHRL